MLIRILKAIAVAIAVYLVLLLVAVVLGLLPIGEAFAEYLRQWGVAIAVLCGLWYGINGGWSRS